jgi:hypothetical protein
MSIAAKDAAQPNGLPLGRARLILTFLKDGAATARPSMDGQSITLSRNGAADICLPSALFASLAKAGWIARSHQNIALSPKAEMLFDALKEADRGSDGSRSSEASSAISRSDIEAGLLHENGTMRRIQRVKVECPVDLLATRTGKNGRAWLSPAEHQAAERLRIDFTRGQMMPGIGMRWDVSPVSGRNGGAGGGVTQTDAAMAARSRFNVALEAVGPEFSGLLVDVCCYLKGLEQVEMERQWPRRSAKVMIKAGLSVLARHYSPVSKRNNQTRHWGAYDYRPSLSL